MKQFLKDYLTFNKREKRGIVILVLIIVALLLFLYISSFFYQGSSSDFSLFEKEINEFSARVDSAEFYESNQDETFRDEKRPSERFYFNPNRLSEKDWQRLGLTEKQVLAVKKFESAGGKFREKEDLKKIYVISEDFYNSVEPYIVIPEDTSGRYYDGTAYHKREKKILAVEINNADSTMFMKLKGIGPGYARRIIKYREALGGYSRIDQIMEVYGLPPQLFDTISLYLEIDTTGIKKMNINKCTIDELKKHPYIKWNVANAIVTYREKHGLFSNVYDIQKTDLVDDDLYRRIAPYLKIE